MKVGIASLTAPLAMQIPFRVTQRTLLLIAIPLVFQVLFVWVLLSLLHQSEIETANEQHAKEVIYEANALNATFTDAGFAMGGYSMTKSAWFLHLYERTIASVPGRFEALRNLIGNDTQQQKILNELEDHWQSMSSILVVAKRAVEAATFEDKFIDEKQLYAQLRAGRNQLSETVAKLISANQSIQRDMPRVKSESRKRIILLLVSMVMASTVLTVSLAYLFNLDLVRKLKLLADNTVKLASGKQLASPLKGNDEIALLDKTFHRMANELAEAARKERDILDNATDVICSIDQKGRITKMNPACLESWGYTPEELLGSNYLAITAGEARDKLGTAFDTVRNSNTPVSVESRLVCKNADVKDVLWSLSWSSIQAAFYCVVHDITEKKRLERLKQDFVDMVSHDLRSPLTSIRATLGLMGDGAFGPLPEIAIDRSQKAEVATVRLIGMINDLLDIERLEAGMLELDCRLVGTGEIIDKSVESVRSLLEERRFDLKKPSKDFPILADEERLIQVLVNLLSNAIKFSPPEGVIQIATVKGPEWVEFSVTDHGKGIAPEYQESVFQRFKQTHKSDSKSKKGFGLGLPICKIIVEQHGGSMGLESKVNEGSRFWFRIPDKD